MPLSDAERQARRWTKLTLERDGFKTTISQLLQEIDRLRQESPAIDRESRELRAKVAQLEADNARLVRELRSVTQSTREGATQGATHSPAPNGPKHVRQDSQSPASRRSWGANHDGVGRRVQGVQQLVGYPMSGATLSQ